MEIRNDKILKFSGRSPNDIYDFDNIYSPDGIGIQLVNSNTQISFINTSPISINTSKLNINFRNSNINLINSNGLLNFNNLSITNSGFVGINSTIPQSSLDVFGRITCFDINLSNSIITSNLINKLGTSINDINLGILSSNCGGTNKSSFQNGQIIFGNNQTQFLNWDDDLKRVGIGMTNPQHSLDINGNINGLFFRTYGRFINDGFSTKDDVSRSSNSSYFASSNNSYKSSYNNTTILKSELIDKIIDYEIWKKYSYGRNYTNLKVGIGNANPTSSLFISGDLNYTGNLRRFGKNIRTFNGDFNDLYNSPGVCWNLSNENIYKANTGSVGIGTTAIPLTILDINGGINYRSNIKQNGNIMKFFNGDYNNLNNLPNISLFGYSGSFYYLTETPDFFNGDYNYLTDIPATFNVDWNKTISNVPKLFKTDWNTTIDNIPSTFNADWKSNIFRKPFVFPTDWDTTIANKPEFFVADWNKSISNKPRTFDTDWTFNILNKPNFSKLAYTGEYDDVLNKPYIFSGDYNDLSNKPKYAEVCFTGNYYDLCNQPRLFNGDYNYLSNIPTYFKTNWNSTILNLPDFKKIATSGSYKDLLDAPIDNWGEIGTHIYSCNSINIGIGKTTPQFNLDINEELNLDNSLIVNYKLGEGSIKTDLRSLLKKNKPWGAYFADDWNGSSIPDSSGNNRGNATSSGTITKTKASGSGATSAITYLYGGYYDNITFPSGSIPSTFTILSLTRYTGGYRQRILQSTSGNWLHGHWSSRRGVCWYEGWKTNANSKGNLDDWLCCIGKNSDTTPNNILIDGVASGETSGGAGNLQLALNTGNFWWEASDWAFNCVIIWDYHLPDDLMVQLNTIIQNALLNGSPQGKTDKIVIESISDIYFSNNLFISNVNISNYFVPITEYKRSSNWVINDSNVYNVNSGSIGINLINPSVSYKLDVVGIINTDTNFNFSSSGAFLWSSYGTAGIGCAGVNAQYSSSSLIGDLVIRSQSGKKLILQNGSNNASLLINSANIGIGITNPTSLIHLHNSNSNTDIKLLLSLLSISKTSNQNLYLNNLYNLRFGTSNLDRLTILGDDIPVNPWAIYIADNYNDGILKDSSGNNRDGIASGTITKTKGSGNGASGSITYISGDVNSYIIFPEGSIPTNFTILSLTRYTGGSRGRLIQSLTANWLHGHWNGNRGVCHYDAWKTSSGNVGNVDDWVCVISKNRGNTPNNILIDGVASGTSSGGTSGTQLTVNRGPYGETTDWAFAYLIIWDRNLTDNEMVVLNNFIDRLKSNNFNYRIGIGITNPSSNLHLHSSNSNVDVNILLADNTTGINGYNVYKNSNQDGCIWNKYNSSLKFGTSNIERMSIKNNYNNIGIGTINPSSHLHLHSSNSNININILLGNPFSIYKSSNRDGCIYNYSNASLRFGTSNLERMCVSGIGNIGIGISNPSSNLHLHNSNLNVEVKCLLTDNLFSTTNTTYKVELYKNSSNDGNIYSYSSLFLGTSNTTRFIIDTSSRIGIGCIRDSSISSTLHLNSSNYSNEVKLLFTDNSTGTTDTSGFAIYKSSSQNGHLWNYSNASLKFGTSNLEKASISERGFLGIGISNPSSLLHLHSSTSNTEVKLILTDASSNLSVFKNTSNDGNIWSYSGNGLLIGTNNLLRIYLNSSGSAYSYVGIGTNYASSLLHLHNSNTSGEVKILFTNGSTGISSTSGFAIYKSGVDDGYIWNYTNNKLQFGTNNLERMCIMNNNVGIGTNNPSSILHLHSSNSNVEVKLLLTDNSTLSTATSGFSIFKNSSNNGNIWNYSNASLRFGTSNTERMTILNNGNIGINNTSPSYTLDASGTINCISFRGNGLNISNLNPTNISTGILPIGRGGININTLNINQILFGNGTTSIGQTANLYWDNGNSKLGVNKTNPATTLDVIGTITATDFTGIGSNLTTLNAGNISSGTLSVSRGGTGATTFTAGQILFGNGTSAIYTSANLFWEIGNSYLGINKTNPSSNLDVSGTITGTFNGNGSAITSLNATNFSLGTLGTARGGTGTSTFASGQILIANDTSAIYTSANLFWDNGNSYLGINKTNPSSNLDVNGTITGTFSGSGLNINSLDATNFSSGTLGVANGGIGTSNLSNGRILFGNTTSALNSSKDLFWNNDNVGLGIGTTIPKYSLEAIGDINFTGDLKRNGISYTGDQGVWTSSGSNIYFNSGNIEIGSEIPSNPNILNIVGTLNCISYRIQYADLDILPSKVYLHLGTSGIGGSRLLYNNNSFIRYAYGGLTTEAGTFYLNIEVLYFRVSSTSTKSTQGFWFDNGSIGIGTRPDTTLRQRLRVSNGTSNNYVISSKITWFDKFNAVLSNLPSGTTIPILSTIFQGNTVCNGVFYFAYFSDIRIKNDINDINSSYAMDLINKIKPKSFKYIDYIEKGHNDNYGFIAQEIKELLPEAITYNKEYIPNVFKLFDINKDIINTNEDLTGLLNIDDEIQIIDTKNKIDCKILEITSSYIKIDKSLEDNKIFVYGKKVDDFHVLNKEYIFTLNVSATQELHKKLEIQEKRIQELDKLLEEEDRKLREQEEKIEFLLNNFF